MSLQLGKDELEAFLEEIFPQIHGDFAIDGLTEDMITMRLKVQHRHLRPGGTVSGPAMFALADVSVYALLMARIGPKALAVTTNCSLDFMRKPAADADIIAKCTMLKQGKTLAIGDILMYSEGMDQPVARSTMTYAIPPK